MTVNALRKSNNAEEETVTLAKSLIKSWKKLVPEANDKKVEKKETPKVVSSRPGFSGDEVRSRCRDLLLSAIKGEGGLPEGTSEESCQG